MPRKFLSLATPPSCQYLKLALALVIGITLTTASLAQAESRLGTQAKIKITKVENSSGHVLVSIFNSPSGFPDNPDQAVWKSRVAASAGQTVVTTPELPEGKYAISVIHDENDNGGLDTGAFGIPTEGFGFSNNPRIRTGPPSFAESKVELSGPRTDVRIDLNHF